MSNRKTAETASGSRKRKPWRKNLIFALVVLVLAAALSYTREQEQAALDCGHAIDYDAVMAPELASFCQTAGLPAAPNALSDAGYMFTLSGADLIRDIYAYCSELAERHVFDAAEVKPGNVIKLVLRLFLIDGFRAMPA